MREIWRDIKDYEGLYQVSNWGRVKSLGNGKSNNSKERFLRPGKDGCGYLQICLCKNGKTKMFLVHRLVATAFLENPNNLPEVNHKDEDKTNNFVGTPENDYRDGNIEWCYGEYNKNYGSRNERISKTMTNGKLSKKVLQFTKTGKFVREWPSANECGRNGFNHGHIVLCCNGERKTHKGYIWKYK